MHSTNCAREPVSGKGSAWLCSTFIPLARKISATASIDLRMDEDLSRSVPYDNGRGETVGDEPSWMRAASATADRLRPRRRVSSLRGGTCLLWVLAVRAASSWRLGQPGSWNRVGQVTSRAQRCWVTAVGR